MPKNEWGLKHICAGCGIKFYDLFRTSIACPKCGKIVDVRDVRSDRKIIIEDVKHDKSRVSAAAVIGEDESVLDDDADVDLVEAVLDDDDSDTVSLGDIADVPKVDDT